MVFSIPGEHLAGQSALWTESTMGPVSWAPTAPPEDPLQSGLLQGPPCTRIWFLDQGSRDQCHQALRVTGIQECALTTTSPQMRRSPIKKVRKSLALDIVDEDVKLMMSTLPKVGQGSGREAVL